MKISSSLARVVKLVVEQRNAESHANGLKAVAAHIQKLKSASGLRTFLAKHKALTREIEDLESSINELGFSPDGSYDFVKERELKSELIPPPLRVEDALAQLATADEKTAVKMLAGLGIKWV